MAAVGLQFRTARACWQVAINTSRRSGSGRHPCSIRPVNRSDFQELAEVHLLNAKALLDAQLYSGAYYMCGYVVECGLKACICKKTSQFDFYPKPRDYSKAWSHDIESLVAVAGLESEFKAARRADPVLDVNWKSAETWSPDSRYDSRSQQEARALFAAISDPDHGVFTCIKQVW